MLSSGPILHQQWSVQRCCVRPPVPEHCGHGEGGQELAEDKAALPFLIPHFAGEARGHAAGHALSHWKC